MAVKLYEEFIRYPTAKDFSYLPNDLRHPDDITLDKTIERKVSVEEADDFGEQLWNNTR